MIPWRLRFSGIRDYTPTVMDFSDKDDHILISGPNGAGKSTITFCMGGVLYSSKVDLEGLKSNNLPSDQTWRAKIELLFKNDGKVKVDAPQFVQFRLDIEQKPGDPIKREFYIEEGDVMDHWERSTKFSSGGNFNFSEYKNQVLYKYAVDPDDFYLIWYQKEVNQFAIMHPEERFRIFSEMNGIDKIQKNWERSKELVKETEQSLQEAESKQGLNKMDLKQKKMMLDRYYDRNRRLEEGFKQYYIGLKWLETYHLKQIDSLKGQITELMDTKEEKLEEKKRLAIHHVEQKEEHAKFTEMLGLLDGRQQELGHELEESNQKLKETQEKLDAISKQIEEITKKVDRIGMTEEEVTNALKEAEQNYAEVDDSIREKEEMSSSLAKTLDILTPELAKLEVEIEQEHVKEKQVRDLMETYHSSNAVQAEMDRNERKLEFLKDELRELVGKEKVLGKELGYLRKNQIYSPRQEQSVHYFEKNKIEVYPLRELLELDESAKQSDEQLFDAIKYTLFVNQKVFQAPNDLYHVPLPNVIPEKSLTHLPDKHIKIKDNLSDNLYVFAVKALWWTQTFFTKEMPVIEKGMLIDRQGIRGPQEENKIILSEKVLKNHQIKLEQELNTIEEKIEQFKEEMDELKKRNSILFGRRESLKDAEAFLTKENEREWRREQFDKLSSEKSYTLEKRDATQSEINKLNTLLAEWKQKVSTYKEFQATYVQFQKEQAKIAEVQKLRGLLAELGLEKKEKNDQLNELEDLLDEKRREERQLVRDLQGLEDRVTYQDREIEQIERQIRNRSDERVTSEEAYSRTRKEVNRLQETAQRLIDEFGEESKQLPETTRPQAEEMRDLGKTKFDNARNETGIDDAAPENYKKMKEEYDRSETEVKKSKLLLEEYTERMERFKEDLEDTINMKIIGVNQKFVHYMSKFGFEGKVDWDMNTDRRGRIRYTLFIKARKEGHRGKLEDVSVKARGGKVGKGVSGGEESLSSLLFALALLQTIEASPGYIVLDEFDSALDEGRKDKVFELYEQELKRKMIILTPKSHEEEYLYRFSKAYVVHHNPNIPKSTVFKVMRVNE
ncbi:AAA family ATPase [Oceanobacillus sp. Castelsardo]|uniref:AAA family ATPase n=1 Tax=Oceanobacillus sp. Castelsardo TaxID=1851204 RepID=UPI000837ED60|nr:AAA family ATPase [Oceanobacillus sp. Castelsardo]